MTPIVAAADASRFTCFLSRYGFGYANVSIRGISSATGAATTGMYLDDTPIQQRNDTVYEAAQP